MKIIFLDIDGVLNSLMGNKIANVFNRTKNRPDSEINSHNLDILRLIIHYTDAKIVISSSWRKSKQFDYNVDNFKKLFAKLGWEDCPIIAVTQSSSGYRGEEVALFLDEISLTQNIEDYIILDDDSDFILEKMSDLDPKYYQQCGLDDNKIYSHYWENQRLILINRLTGLSYGDLIEVLKIWAPDCSMMDIHNSYIPYMHRYGKKFSD
jgi:uncharacterized protein (UPF0371 family)